MLKNILQIVVLLLALNCLGCDENGKNQEIKKPTSTTKNNDDKNFINDNHQKDNDENIVLLKNDGSVLPFDPAKSQLTIIEQEHTNDIFKEYTSYYTTGRFLSENDFVLDSNQIKNTHLIYLISVDSMLNKEVWTRFRSNYSSTKKTAILFCNSTNILDSNFYNHFDAIVLANENESETKKVVAQALFGAKGFYGKLKNDFSFFKKDFGIRLNSNGRLGFSSSTKFGIPEDSLNIIDSIALRGIKEKAYPGCQVLISVKGNIIYNKSFGQHTYSSKSKKVDNQDVFDLASITKIASSTLLTMQLHSEQKINLNNSLGFYLDEAKNTAYGSVSLKSMMAHQAGFTSWIPFYKKTLLNGNPNPIIYSKKISKTFSNPVAKNLFMNKHYEDSIYSWIYNAPLKSKTYRYSDLCFYFMKKILEKQTDETLDEAVYSRFYQKMGLQTMGYNPLKKIPKTRILPTERDFTFRNQLVHGFVHDQGAAMMGGVGGHAGLFSNAYDLAVIMQLFLNQGQYAGNKYLNPNTVQEFTKQQYSKNRRGAGFDRPKINGGGTCDERCSQKSFGHSGFTGTLAWADPFNEVIVIFLSNRVYPDAQNWKLLKLNIRTDIQHEVYGLLESSKN